MNVFEKPELPRDAAFRESPGEIAPVDVHLVTWLALAWRRLKRRWSIRSPEQVLEQTRKAMPALGGASRDAVPSVTRSN